MADLQEKTIENDKSNILHEYRTKEGYILQDTDGQLKHSRDGNILIPQPSDDPDDPLNWSSVKKHVMLLIVSFTALLPDYGSATGAVTLIPQAVYGTLPLSMQQNADRLIANGT